MTENSVAGRVWAAIQRHFPDFIQKERAAIGDLRGDRSDAVSAQNSCGFSR
jgi:hypothetical protein